MMTEVETPVEVEPVADANASLRARLQARAAELTAQHPIIIPIPGCEDLFAAEYKVLDLPDLAAIGMRQEKAGKDDTAVLQNALADTLLKACVRLREVEPGVPEEQWRDTGFRWGSRAARELFDVDLPEGATERTALLLTWRKLLGERYGRVLLDHYTAYDEASQLKAPKIAEGIEGESTPARAGI